MLSYPTPKLAHGADEALLVRIGNVVFPGDVERIAMEGVRIWVDHPLPSPSAREQASAMFDFMLGVLRAWRPMGGELEVELPERFAPGPIRDDAGNTWVEGREARAYGTAGDDLERFAADANVAGRASEELRRALMLNGRARRTGADFYMIHEYALMRFADMKGVRDALGVSVKQQKRLRQSAGDLSPFEGGRHVQPGPGAAVPMNLSEQGEVIAELLRAWIAYEAQTASEPGLGVAP